MKQVRRGQVESLVEQLAHRGRGPFELAGVHFGHERSQRLAGTLLRPDEGLDRSGAFLGDRIVAGEGLRCPMAR